MMRKTITLMIILELEYAKVTGSPHMKRHETKLKKNTKIANNMLLQINNIICFENCSNKRTILQCKVKHVALTYLSVAGGKNG